MVKDKKNIISIEYSKLYEKLSSSSRTIIPIHLELFSEYVVLFHIRF
jgi:hypothetical protein